ncbi:hypothetical protein VP199E371_P0070 [Vibrio phage 199E37-1]|nr:hypothetical protein VP199E371_P0070 [Vibrio phage 199E37-1]
MTSYQFDISIHLNETGMRGFMSTEDKPKQRAVYFTDSEWEEVKKAAKKSNQRNTTHFVNVEVMKSVKRVNK